MGVPCHNSNMSGDLYVGLMCGTSLDGIDAVLVAVNSDGVGCRVQLLRSHFAPFDDPFRRRLGDLSAANYGERDPIEEQGRLHRAVGERFARAVRKLLAGKGGDGDVVDPARVVAVGSHGVTIRHRPAGNWRGRGQAAHDVNNLSCDRRGRIHAANR